MKNLFLISLFFGLAIHIHAQLPTGSWSAITPITNAEKRHESGFLECDGKFYALGGRGIKPVEVYDPKSNRWDNLGTAPIEFHHFQAMSFQHEIYIIAALTGKYPHEQPIDHFLIFNPKTKSWRDGAALPSDRIRGSAGICSYKNKIYIVSGIQDGHWAGHVTWFDEYDPSTSQWRKLPDAPRARDHFQAAILGDKLYVAGGRTSHAAIGKVLDLTIGEVDVFDFKSGKWSTLANPLPTLRAGTTSVVKKPYIIVMNGESSKQVPAHSEVEALDTRTGNWVRLPDLMQGRHGTSAVYWKHKMYVMAGSANRGGGPELNTMECLPW